MSARAPILRSVESGLCAITKEEFCIDEKSFYTTGVMRRENFEKAARNLFDLLRTAQVKKPIWFSWFVIRQAWATLFYIGLATPASTMVQIILCGVYFVYTLRNGER